MFSCDFFLLKYCYTNTVQEVLTIDNNVWRIGQIYLAPLINVVSFMDMRANHPWSPLNKRRCEAFNVRFARP